MAENSRTVAERWAQRYANSVDKFEAKINALTVSPMEQAAAKKSDWIAALAKKEVQDKWEERLKSANFQDWKRKTIKMAKERMQGGAQEALPKFQKFFDQWGPHLDTVKAEVRKMPKGKGANNRARMLKAFDMNSGFKYRR